MPLEQHISAQLRLR